MLFEIEEQQDMQGHAPGAIMEKMQYCIEAGLKYSILYPLP